MPSRKAHEWVAKLHGHNPAVDEAIDLPFLFVGRGHRKYFHKPEEAALIGAAHALANGEDVLQGAIGGILHVEVDKASSANREVKAVIELTARAPSKGRARVRKRR